MSRLENWSVFTWTPDSYTSPECGVPTLVGELYGDERFPDGKGTQTSEIMEINIKKNYARTKHSEYILGKPSPDWLEWLIDSEYKLEDYNCKRDE